MPVARACSSLRMLDACHHRSDVQGLADIAEAHLRLASRFAECAEDVDAACRPASARDRAARGDRQELLIKSRG